MLRYVYADELHKYPKLAEGMFRDRADQFKTRLGWDVHVNDKGEERDQYDDLNPIYVIWEEPDGSHGQSAYRRCYSAQRGEMIEGFGLTHIAGVFDARIDSDLSPDWVVSDCVGHTR
ncbi:acyl-homoserine-lactone synthase [Ruegeria arenilitoris]|uniref:acyl-homoserine-lactone synthase n=1 Tax=Ruegeria arenilitoris TaxID=1173585 RepID=UPI003F5CD272